MIYYYNDIKNKNQKQQYREDVSPCSEQYVLHCTIQYCTSDNNQTEI